MHPKSYPVPPRLTALIGLYALTSASIIGGQFLSAAEQLQARHDAQETRLLHDELRAIRENYQTMAQFGVPPANDQLMTQKPAKRLKKFQR